MDEYRYPENFEELVEMLSEMTEEECCENDDSGHKRYVERTNMHVGNYALYEDGEFIGATFDVVSVAQFIAVGWEVYERMECHE